MTSVDECRARFGAACEVFEVQEGQPTENYVTMIVEAIGGVLFTLRYDVEKGKDNLIGMIVEDPEYVRSLVAHLGGRHVRDFTTTRWLAKR